MTLSTSINIIASIPGRLRVRGHSLKNPDQIEKFKTALAGLHSSCSFQVNSAAGSLILFYDARQCAKAEMENAVTEVLNETAFDSNTSGEKMASGALVTTNTARNRRALMRQANRYSKYAMFANLGASLLLAARGAKYAHALTGMVFVGALGVHLLVHRKHLLS